MTLRTRLLLSYILIVVLCLGIAAISVSVLLQNYRDQASLSRLDDITRPINTQIRSLLRGQTTIADVWTNIQEQAQNFKIYILFVDSRGNLIRQASPDVNSPQLTVPGSFPHGFSQASGGTFTTTSGQTFIYWAYPLLRAVDAQSPRAETEILCQPQGNMAAILAGVISPFIWAGLIALVISLVLAFFMARSVYQPIQRLSRAATNIAQGHYDEMVPETGTDEIRRLAVSFNEMATKVKASQQQLRHFVADVSHQLKSPLTSIQGFAQAMLDGTANDEETRLKATRIIVDESKRMIRQVNELLELSRMQAGQVKMIKEPVDVKELLWHCREIFALRIEEKGIKFKEQVEPLMVVGDADRLEDVFCNLLDNAIKNTSSQGEIQLIAQSHDNIVEATVADTGPGIPPEQLPYVFERFQQSSGLRSGFGLGLAIAREIILAHGGKIEVTSNPGEGAKFTVTLPAFSEEKKEI
jgi:two-component system, OmpR family, sensor kinase